MIFLAFITGLIIGGIVTVLLYEPYKLSDEPIDGFDGTDNA
jgi:hypothetical protein